MTNYNSEHLGITSQDTVIEHYITLQQAAAELGVHVWALRRAVKSGTVPAYAPFNSRKLVKLSEVVAYINSCRQGGAD